MSRLILALVLAVASSSLIAEAACPYDINGIHNPYGAGNPSNTDPLSVAPQ